jgi:hypothetical protein
MRPLGRSEPLLGHMAQESCHLCLRILLGSWVTHDARELLTRRDDDREGGFPSRLCHGH